MALFSSGTAEKKAPSSAPMASNGNGTVSTTPEGATCIIAKGTVIEGKITTSENIRIDGTIKGEVRCDKRLVMDAGGLIEGNVFAGESTIKGRVVGTVSVTNTLHLLESSFIKGDIKAKKLHVEEGAKYDGKCLIG
jgi:cytoskeletal protein CcmA (bactofilin family)